MLFLRTRAHECYSLIFSMSYYEKMSMIHRNKETLLNVQKTKYDKTSLKFDTKANKLNPRIGNSSLFHQLLLSTSTYGQPMRCFSSTAAVSTGNGRYGILKISNRELK